MCMSLCWLRAVCVTMLATCCVCVILLATCCYWAGYVLNHCVGHMQAWSQLGGILCVSEAVSTYLQHWWPAPGFGLTQELPPMRVVPLSTFGCFGHGPFEVRALVSRSEAHVPLKFNAGTKCYCCKLGTLQHAQKLLCRKKSVAAT